MMGTRTPNLSSVSTIFGTARGRFVGVDGDAHQLGAGVGQRHHLIHRRRHVGGIGVGHGLDDDGVVAADLHTSDVDRHDCGGAVKQPSNLPNTPVYQPSVRIPAAGAGIVHIVQPAQVLRGGGMFRRVPDILCHTAERVEYFEFPAQGYEQVDPGKQCRQAFISTLGGAIPEFAEFPDRLG